MSSGGDKDRSVTTGSTQGCKLRATVSEPANRLVANLSAASILSSDWPVPKVNGVAAAGVADARPRIRNAEVAAVIRWCISVSHPIVSARISAHPHGPAVDDCGPRKAV